MAYDMPPYWDTPEGIIIKWICFGVDYPDNIKGYTKNELKEKYLLTIKDTKYGLNLIYKCARAPEYLCLGSCC